MNGRLVHERMRANILTARIRPGSKMNIAALAASMEVSAGAVREALAMLEADNLVSYSPNRGYRVVAVSATDLRHLVAARIAIEKLCIAEALRHGDVAWEGTVVAAFHRLGRHQERDAGQGYFLSESWTAAHGEFHQAIAAGCPNVWLRRMQSSLYRQSERYRQLSVPAAVGDRDVQSEHKALMDAVLNRQLERCLLLISEHLQTTADLVLASAGLGTIDTP